jgi:tungstate transport system substrate-binding protein
MIPRLISALIFLLAATPAAADQPLRLATTTTTVDSGLTDVLLPAFERHSGHRVELHAVGTGTALRWAREGKVDVVLVHAPTAEQRFVRDGYGLVRHQVMHNDFIIVGPSQDPVGLHGQRDIKRALTRLRDRQGLFLSRADDSGTHKKELALWQAAGIDPYGQDWYQEVGMSMSQALQQASARRAYTLTDRGTWLALRDRLQLALLVEGDPLLANPYGVIAVNPARHQGINAVAATAFVDWLCSPAAQRLIRDYRLHGEPLFIPDLPTE